MYSYRGHVSFNISFLITLSVNFVRFKQIMMIDKKDLETTKKRLDLIEKVYTEKYSLLEDADTKEDAFKEGINAAIQSLNLHSVSKSFL